MTVLVKGRWQDKNGSFLMDTNRQKACSENSDMQKIRMPPVCITGLWSIYSPQRSGRKLSEYYRAAVAKAKHGERSDLKTRESTPRWAMFMRTTSRKPIPAIWQNARRFPASGGAYGGSIPLAGIIDVKKIGSS